MSLRSTSHNREREPSRSRFRVALTLAGAIWLSGCSNYYGAGITELPAERGWQPLPIEAWVLNDGLAARAMSFCPRATCTRQGFAALVTVEGREADAMARTLATDPVRLAQEFGSPTPETIKAAKKARRTLVPKSATTVTRYQDDGANGLLVEIRALDPGGKRAFTAILSGRDGDRLVLALAVSPDADAARASARAAWHDR